MVYEITHSCIIGLTYNYTEIDLDLYVRKLKAELIYIQGFIRHSLYMHKKVQIVTYVKVPILYGKAKSTNFVKQSIYTRITIIFHQSEKCKINCLVVNVLYLYVFRQQSLVNYSSLL